jgi:hypothetical protein
MMESISVAEICGFRGAWARAMPRTDVIMRSVADFRAIPMKNESPGHPRSPRSTPLLFGGRGAPGRTRRKCCRFDQLGSYQGTATDSNALTSLPRFWQSASASNTPSLRRREPAWYIGFDLGSARAPTRTFSAAQFVPSSRVTSRSQRTLAKTIPRISRHPFSRKHMIEETRVERRDVTADAEDDPDSGDYVANRCGQPPRREQVKR